MAEAHSIAQLSTGLQGLGSRPVQLLYSDRGITLTVTIPRPKEILRNVRRRWWRTHNALVDSLFPMGLLSVVIIVVGLVGMVLLSERSSWLRSGRIASFVWAICLWLPGFSLVPLVFQLCVAATVAGVIGTVAVMAVHRYLIRALLTYHGWFYSEPGEPMSLTVRVWGAVLKAMTFTMRSPLLFAYQGSLPRLPLPSLELTAARYLDTIRPLRTPDEMAAAETRMRAFLANEGPKLHWYLKLKSWLASNYVADWWERYVYLRGRSPIMINSNYYICDAVIDWPTRVQTARAAAIVSEMVHYSRLIVHEKLAPQMLKGTVPLCMEQYRRMFCTTRVPGLECDEVVHVDPAEVRHIVVLYHGVFTAVDVYVDGEPMSPWQIEAQLERVKREVDAGPRPTDAEAAVPALTAGNRTRWAEARLAHFSSPLNETSLALIERAIIALVLDDNAPTEPTDNGRLAFHGTGADRWFDKSVTLIVFENGKFGVNCEHSWADALAVGHMIEWSCSTGTEDFDSAGRNKRPSGGVGARELGYTGRRLRFELSAEGERVVLGAWDAARALIADTDLTIYRHPWGKGAIKRSMLSPDGFIQMAMQLAYFRSRGALCLTYESAMTRFYREGRTETVRSCTVEAKRFVEAMEDRNATKDSRRDALRAAVARHAIAFRDSMCGHGVDRHLFALYVVSIGKGIPSDFLKDAVSEPWRLSTSQQPQRQTERWAKFTPEQIERRISPGGGFGPVADDGYGVSYMVAGENTMFFHVSSKRSCSETDSTRFAAQIARALDDMRELFA